jgi:hypothetical protein
MTATRMNWRRRCSEFRRRTINKEKTTYCYSEAERDNAVRKSGGKPIIKIALQRRLCEIGPKEFFRFKKCG